MTPKEKAKELVEKYYHLFSVELENTIFDYEAKECALIALDLILDRYFIFTASEFGQDSLGYWQEVKQEINLL